MVFVDQTRLGLWILDGDIQHRSLLRYAITKDSFSHTLVILVVSMAQPWSIMESLQRWSDTLSTHVDRLKLSPEDRRDYEQQRKIVFYCNTYVVTTLWLFVYVCVAFSQSLTMFFTVVRQFQQYEEPGEGQAQSKRKSKSDDEQVLLPLGENTLTHNLGIPIVVVVTKVSLRDFARYVGVHVCM